MKPAVHKQQSRAIIYDAGCLELPAVESFDAGYWLARNALQGQATGRGSAWFIDAPFGSVVLRRYLRGGWAAKLSRQHYFFSTVARSRPFREFNVLTALHESGLPVPRPVAALCEHRGFFASGAIMTARIAGAQTLVEVLSATRANTERWLALWADVGRCIRRFHIAGVWHADLNACNILLDAKAQVFLIDFDRARFTPGQAVNGTSNLLRLNRSLWKLWPAARRSEMQPAWVHLMAAYHA